MQVTPLAVSGAWLFEPTKHEDDCGVFLEWLRRDLLEQIPSVIGSTFTKPTDRSRGPALCVACISPRSLRGQAKYIVCVHGAVLDVVVDICIGSPTYGQWASILLDDQNKRVVYIAEGLGHGFMAMTEGATVVYLCSAPYAPGREHGHPPPQSRTCHRLARDGPRRLATQPAALPEGHSAANAGGGRRAGYEPRPILHSKRCADHVTIQVLG